MLKNYKKSRIYIQISLIFYLSTFNSLNFSYKNTSIVFEILIVRNSHKCYNIIILSEVVYRSRIASSLLDTGQRGFVGLVSVRYPSTVVIVDEAELTELSWIGVLTPNDG
jgi:hypothetical protein